MDIHRCRFVKYHPQPINALSFSHVSDPNEPTPSDLRLAIGRSNGEIEIWNPQHGLWVQEAVLKGVEQTTIEYLTWTQDLIHDEQSGTSQVVPGPLRLFSIAGSTSLTEWDICTGREKRRAEGNSGDIWCFAAQPQLQRHQAVDASDSDVLSPLLAVGCSNGTVVLFSTAEDDLRFVRTMLAPPVKKPKVLSITWRDRNTVVAGYEDSTIRVIDVHSRTPARSLTLGKPANASHSIVWAVKCLPDGTILSGDSSGELKIWDSKTLSLTQRLKSHNADVLDITASASGDVIFSHGVDRRTVSYRPVSVHPGSKKSRWAEFSHRRFHQNDVKSSASFESRDLSVLVSGGMDTRPVIVPIREAKQELHRSLSHLPQRPFVSASPVSRTFISWWQRELVIYHVTDRPAWQENRFDFDTLPPSSYTALARLVVNDNEEIRDAQLSVDGQYVAVTTTQSVKLFQLRKSRSSNRPCLRTRRLTLPPFCARLGARRAGFSPDNKWLCIVRTDNSISLLKLELSSGPDARLLVHANHARLSCASSAPNESALGAYKQTITTFTFSSDGRTLAVGDLSGAVYVWLLEGREDLASVKHGEENADQSSSSSSSASSDEDEDDSPTIHGQKWIRNPAGWRLPMLDSSILALTFRPKSKSIDSLMGTEPDLPVARQTHQPFADVSPYWEQSLFVISASHQLVEFDVLDRRLSAWSRRNPSDHLPPAFTRIKDRAIGCFWDCADPENRGERLWMYGSSWLFMLDVSRDLSILEDGKPLPVLKGDVSDPADAGRTLGHYNVTEPSAGMDLDSAVQIHALALEEHSNKPRNTHSRKRKRNTGAGDDIPSHEREHRPVQEWTTDGENMQMAVAMSAARGRRSVDSDWEDDSAAHGNSLLQLRRRNGASNDDESAPSHSAAHKSTPPYFVTFNYQAILGVGVIGPWAESVNRVPKDSNDARAAANLEVVIVERPLHDIDQVPRFEGGQDWGT